MVTFQDLRDAHIGGLRDAADGWLRLARKVSQFEERARAEVTRPIAGSGWEGDAAGAALAELHRAEQEIALAALLVENVRLTLQRAAEEFQAAQDELRGVLDDAAALRLRVLDDGSVELPPLEEYERHDPWFIQQRLQAQAREVAERIEAAVRRATEADARYAAALAEFAATDPAAPYAWADAAADSRLAACLAGVDESAIPSPGTDPKRVAEWWQSLTEDQRRLYTQLFPQRVGALDGLPATDRDQANRLALRERIGELANKNPYLLSDFEKRDLARLRALQARLESGGYAGGRGLYLLGFDPHGDGKAIVAVGNPDTAAHTAVYVPGTATALDDMPGQINRAERLARRSDDLTPSRRGDVAVVAWLGYDTPEDLARATQEGRAQDGAAALDRFVDGLRVAQGPEHRHITALGHSYGSTLVGETASRHGLAVDDIVTAGSPGMRVDHASDLGIDPRHVWAGAAEDDPISGWAGNFVHGQEPSDPDFGANRFHVDTHGHSGYWDPDSQSITNQARIIVGRYDEVSLDHGKAPS